MTTEVSLALLRDGYRFASHMSEPSDAPASQRVRVLGRRALLVAGEEGVRLFYDRDLMRRSGAAPDPLSDELFVIGTVHRLDGRDHADE